MNNWNQLSYFLNNMYYRIFFFLMYISYQTANNNIQVQVIENCYKQCNTEIVELCTQISNTPLFGNELELMLIKGLSHNKDKLRFAFKFLFI